jgi:hypothetical protein
MLKKISIAVMLVLLFFAAQNAFAQTAPLSPPAGKAAYASPFQSAAREALDPPSAKEALPLPNAPRGRRGLFSPAPASAPSQPGLGGFLGRLFSKDKKAN